MGDEKESRMSRLTEDGSTRCILVNTTDGSVYDITDRAADLCAQSIQQQIKEAREESCQGCSGHGGEDRQHLFDSVREEEGQSVAQEYFRHFQEVSAAEVYLEISNLFMKLMRHAM